MDIETKCNGDTPLDREEEETQDILDMNINWIVYCDGISLGTTGFEFIVVEEDLSVGTLFSRTSRVAFIPETEVTIFDTTESSASLLHQSNRIYMRLTKSAFVSFLS